MWRFSSLGRVFSIFAVLTAPVYLGATIQLSLSPGLASPQRVGTPVVWTATATDSNPGALTYRFVVAPQGGQFAIVRDYSYNNTFRWVQSASEGNFVVGVFVKNSQPTRR